MRNTFMAAVVIWLSILTFTAPARVITNEETWQDEVILNEDITVAFGATLIILPGAVIKCQPKTDEQQGGTDANLIEIIIDGGEFIAAGTVSQPITFTSAAESPAKGDWFGIRLIKGLLTLQHCNESFGVIGFQLEGSVPKVLDHCSFTQNSDKGALLSTTTRLSNCSFEKNSVGVHSENGVRLDKCTISTNDKDGISGTGVFILTDCTIKENEGAGINLNGTVRLTDCVLTENKGIGIKLSGRTNSVEIINSDITFNGSTGISLSGGSSGRFTLSNTVTVSDSTIAGNNGAAVDLRATSSRVDSSVTNTVTISSSTITGNNGIGLNLQGGSFRILNNTVTISNTLISANGGTGIKLTGSGIQSTIHMTISNSKIVGNSENGIQGGIVSLTDSTITNNGGFGVFLTAIGEEGFSNNEISQNIIGIEIQSSAEKIEGISGNKIFDNISFDLKNSGKATVIANDNEWGEPTPTELKSGIANLTMIYDQQDDTNVGPVNLLSNVTPLPIIAQVAPDVGTVGQTVQIMGANFIDGATVTFGTIAASVSIVSSTEITLIVPAGNTDGWVDIHVQNPGGGSTTLAKAFRYFSELPTVPITPTYTSNLELTKGINIISLPLNPDTPFTASSLAATLKSTIVIRTVDGGFDAYVHATEIGEDFPISSGAGYIVNIPQDLLPFVITGKPWGTPVPAAPPVNTPSAPWAFVVAGQIDEDISTGEHLRVINSRTGASVVVPISPSGKFAAAFVDLSKQPVVAAGDEIVTQLIGDDGELIGTSQRHALGQPELDGAYLLTRLSTLPNSSRLLQNFPNPFNPETWIPFQLASDADVTISIYDIHGRLVRRLDLGHQAAGYYVSRSRATYWDGRNASGERVSSGVYFYRISAADHTAVHRMAIVK